MRSSFQLIRSRKVHYVLWILLPALLLAQWMGLAHRSAHAAWMGGKPLAQVVATALVPAATPFSLFEPPAEGKHSCAAFDAATLAECLHSVALLPVVVLSIAVVGIHSAGISWHALLQLHFRSQAPPFV